MTLYLACFVVAGVIAIWGAMITVVLDRIADALERREKGE